MKWSFPGSPVFLKRQAKRLGLTEEMAHACRNNPELYKLSGLIGQLCGNLNEIRQAMKSHVVPPSELPAIEAALARCETEVRMLHLEAASADDMLGEAWRMFGLTRPRNPFEIMSDLDSTAVEPEVEPHVNAHFEPADAGELVYANSGQSPRRKQSQR